MNSLTPDETILGLLALRPRHGYELLDCFHDSSQLGEVWRLSTSQLYAVLKRLESQALTEGHEVLVPDAPTRLTGRPRGHISGARNPQLDVTISRPSDPAVRGPAR